MSGATPLRPLHVFRARTGKPLHLLHFKSVILLIMWLTGKRIFVVYIIRNEVVRNFVLKC
jgi:hypothetical protein